MRILLLCLALLVPLFSLLCLLAYCLARVAAWSDARARAAWERKYRELPAVRVYRDGRTRE